MTEADERLIEEAKRARLFSYSPYSGFKVGAAVLADNGKIYRGCNVENRAYSVTNCAERTAIFNAAADGETELLALAVVADSARPVPPCGACRQVMTEFHIGRVLMANLDGEVREMTVEELLPCSFAEGDM